MTDLKVLESRIIPYHQSVCATKPLAQLDVQTVCRSDNKKEARAVCGVSLRESMDYRRGKNKQDTIGLWGSLLTSFLHLCHSFQFISGGLGTVPSSIHS